MSPLPSDHDPKLPQDWDLLGLETGTEGESASPGGFDEHGMPALREERSAVPFLFSGVADLVVMLAGCAGALAAVRAQGLPVSVWALPWTAAMGLVVWAALATATVYVRRATPGMVMMRVAFREPIAPGRLPRLVLFGFVSAVLLGAPIALAGRSDRLAGIIGGSPLEPLP